MGTKKKVPNPVLDTTTSAETSGVRDASNDNESIALPYNPASDPSLSAQERLAALTKQHEDMHANPVGTYPLEAPEQ